jgi:hypothetical protein
MVNIHFNLSAFLSIFMSVVGFTPLNANGGGMKRWGLRSDSLSRYTTLDASHNP